MLTDKDFMLLAFSRAWIETEYRKYVRNKFTLEDDKERDLDWWQQQFDNYFHRARTLGLDTPGGRQAVGKFAATAVGWFMTVLATEGSVPAPGVASGGNFDDEWKLEI
jgi:hypothetical protein